MKARLFVWRGGRWVCHSAVARGDWACESKADALSFTEAQWRVMNGSVSWRLVESENAESGRVIIAVTDGWDRTMSALGLSAGRRYDHHHTPPGSIIASGEKGAS